MNHQQAFPCYQLIQKNRTSHSNKWNNHQLRRNLYILQKQTDNEKTETFRYKKKNIFFYKLTLWGFANCCSFATGKKEINCYQV